MKILHISGVLALGLVRSLAEGEVKDELVIPDALKFTGSQIAKDENNLPRFFDALGKLGASKNEDLKAVREARQQLIEGKEIQNVELLENLRARHIRTNKTLTPPLAFPPDMELSALVVYHLFQGSEVLVRQAMLEKDYTKADGLIEDMFRWNHLLRNSRPPLIQMLTAIYGWQHTFNLLLRDWVNSPEQGSRFDQIQKFAANNRLERSELIDSFKAEFHWYVNLGGLRKMLADERYAGMSALLLKPPFNKLSVSQLLKLPYDFQVDLRRESEEALSILECLKNGDPLSRWPRFKLPANVNSLKDYEKRPNGLGDLFKEQVDSTIAIQGWATILNSGPLLDACLKWLKLEQDGQPITETSFTEFLDPVDGKPLHIDVKNRTIQSRGLNLKIDPPDADGPPPLTAGFFMRGDDSIIVIPRWR